MNQCDLLVQFTAGALALAKFDLDDVCKTLPELNAYVESTATEHGFPYDAALGIEGNRIREVTDIFTILGIPFSPWAAGQSAASWDISVAIHTMLAFFEAARERELDLKSDAAVHRLKAGDYGSAAAAWATRSSPAPPGARDAAATYAVHAASHARDAIRIEEGAA